MTIDQAIAKLQEEKRDELSSRFPCRAIMVQNIAQYNELVSKLLQIAGTELVSSDSLFSAPDIMPRYENLINQEYQERWVVLTGVGEYLRLFSQKEAEAKRFKKIWSYQAPASSKGRILIPLWGCETQWHDKSLHLCDDIRQDEFFFDCTNSDEDEQKLSYIIMTGEFKQYKDQLSQIYGRIIDGLKEWYEEWVIPNTQIESFVLLTDRAASIQQTDGSVTVHVIRDRLSFIQQSIISGEKLTTENCPIEAQELLFQQAMLHQELDKAILVCLNIASFKGVDVMSKWDHYSVGQKQLVVLWYRLHPDGTYLCNCISRTNKIDDIPSVVLYHIFSCGNRTTSWIQESQQITKLLQIPKGERFYQLLDSIPNYEERLMYLSGKTKNDRIYLLRLIGRWLREDPEQLRGCEVLRDLYPELDAYLDSSAYDEELGRYFTLYKAHKLENSLPADEEMYFAGIDVDAYELRYPLLSDAITEDTIVLWIDALGAEWTSLLAWALGSSMKGKMTQVRIAQAILPSETCYNDLWNKMSVPYEKLNKLDKLAHKGVIDDPDYYACIEDQISFVQSIKSKVDQLLEHYQRVIITGDHGTSRIAARFFHQRCATSQIPKSEIRSHGRYCKLLNEAVTLPSNMAFAKDDDGNTYAVFKNYDHFSISGFAAGGDDENVRYGEIHGGATPEEALVPVIVIDSKEETPLKAEWPQEPIKIMMKKIKVPVRFNKSVKNVTARIGAVEGACTKNQDGKQWLLQFTGIQAGEQVIAITADGCLFQSDPIKVLPAIQSSIGDLP